MYYRTSRDVRVPAFQKDGDVTVTEQKRYLRCRLINGQKSNPSDTINDKTNDIKFVKNVKELDLVF